MAEDMRWANHIKRLRYAAAMTQRELANKLGVESNSIALFERGMTIPDSSIQQQIKRLLIDNENCSRPSLIESLPGYVALVHTSPWGEIHSCTPAIAQWYGHSDPKELRGHIMADRLRVENQALALLENNVLWNRGEVAFAEIIYKENIHEAWIRAQIAPIEDISENLMVLLVEVLGPPYPEKSQLRLVPFVAIADDLAEL